MIPSNDALLEAWLYYNESIGCDYFIITKAESSKLVILFVLAFQLFQVVPFFFSDLMRDNETGKSVFLLRSILSMMKILLAVFCGTFPTFSDM